MTKICAGAAGQGNTMKHEDIIKMAKEYADEVTNGHGIVTYEFDAYGLEKFALLIVAAERERIIAANAPEIEKLNVYIKAIRARLAGWEKLNMNDHKEGDLGIGTVKWDASAPLVVHPHPAFQATQPDLAKVGEVGVWGERQWQGLTDEEIAACIQMGETGSLDGFMKPLATYRAIEAKLKEKNAL